MKIRSPRVAGSFYPSDREKLKNNLSEYFDNSQVFEKFNDIYGIISPHAGHIYSGLVAAYSYKIIKNSKIRKFIILAPSHQNFFQGFSIYPGDCYSTPLGNINLCKEVITKLLSNKNIRLSNQGHEGEHSLEVQLPFLQYMFNNTFEIVPIVIGDFSPDMLDSLADSLYELSKDEEFLVIASSDLSHFHSYEIARQIDGHLLELLESYDLDKIKSGILNNSIEACGITTIYTLMKFASMGDEAKLKIVDYRNSGDTAGDKFRVVGYASGVVYQ